MPKHPATEIEILDFAGTDAELFVKLESWAQEGKVLVAIHDWGSLRYVYLRRIVAPGQYHRYEQQRISLGGEKRDVQAVINRESLAGWNFGTVYCGKDGEIYIFLFRLVAPPDIEEKG